MAVNGKKDVGASVLARLKKQSKDTNLITNIPEISAIYFALLQCGYDFYSIERSLEHIRQIEAFYVCNTAEAFFDKTKQNTCEVYSYWPRAAMLETASFYVDCDKAQFVDFDLLQNLIMSADNIADAERSQEFWNWMVAFPQTLKNVINNSQFVKYFEWECQWIQKQNDKHFHDLILVQKCLDFCREVYNSPVKEIQIVLSPIKCVYSSDYHMIDDRFIFSSGAFRIESVIHEFLHHVVHPIVIQHGEKILAHKQKYSGIDDSYYFSDSDRGQKNAFEEYAVRLLTSAFMSKTQPDDLDVYIMKILNSAEVIS